MSQRSDRPCAAGAALPGAAPAARAASVLALALAHAPHTLAAQTPVPPPAPRDTLRADSTRARSDSVRAAAADSLRRAASDSTARDSAVARAMRRPEGEPTVFGQLGIDRLRLSAIGATLGWAWPRRTVGTQVYGVEADYGEVAPRLRVVFAGSYWTTHYTDGAVREFEQSVADATGADSVNFGRIRSSDLSLAADLRWRPGRAAGRTGGGLRPFFGAGPTLHFADTEGVPLNGTFVEQALDGVAIGLGAIAGLDATLLPNVILTMHARYDLFSGSHYASIRAGASYRFDVSPTATRVRQAGGDR